jgi:hypothetical protein
MKAGSDIIVPIGDWGLQILPLERSQEALDKLRARRLRVGVMKPLFTAEELADGVIWLDGIPAMTNKDHLVKNCRNWMSPAFLNSLEWWDVSLGNRGTKQKRTHDAHSTEESHRSVQQRVCRVMDYEVMFVDKIREALKTDGFAVLPNWIPQLIVSRAVGRIKDFVAMRLRELCMSESIVSKIECRGLGDVPYDTWKSALHGWGIRHRLGYSMRLGGGRIFDDARLSQADELCAAQNCLKDLVCRLYGWADATRQLEGASVKLPDTKEYDDHVDGNRNGETNGTQNIIALTTTRVIVYPRSNSIDWSHNNRFHKPTHAELEKMADMCIQRVEIPVVAGDVVLMSFKGLTLHNIPAVSLEEPTRMMTYSWFAQK